MSRSSVRPALFRRATALALGVAGLALAHPALGRCQDRFALALFLGASESLDSRFEVSQSGQATLDFTGDLESRPFHQPLYWTARFSWTRSRSALELQFVHQKLHLVDAPPEIQAFEISHGFNLLTANYVRRLSSIDVRFGGGIVVAHPESTVRGFTWSDGYVLTGPTFIAGAGRALRVWERFSVVPEGFVSVSRAHVPVAEGEASFWDVAFHVLLGGQVSF